MANAEDYQERFRKAAQDAARAADAELAAELGALKARTAADLAALKPQVSDPASYDQLIAAVQEATARNESLAQLQARVVALGDKAVAIAKEAAKLLV